MVQNIMTVDVEDFFCASNLESVISRKEWNNYSSSLIHNTERILQLFKKNKTEATFFILGWVAEKYPDLISHIEEEGHEIATHGYAHQLITQMTKESFEEDLKRSISVIRKCVKSDILGFRAPSFTVTKKTLWVIEILKKYGFKYDASVFPISFHPVYGYPSSPLSIHTISNGIKEIPISCLEILKLRIPCTGGAYFRILPYFITKLLFTLQNKKGLPVIFYIHPWEIDPAQPRYQLPFNKRLRHYYNLSKTLNRLENILQDFQFTSIRNVLCLKKGN